MKFRTRRGAARNPKAQARIERSTEQARMRQELMAIAHAQTARMR